jgi:hypothetical protein
MRRAVCALSIAALVGGAVPLSGQSTEPGQTQPKAGAASDKEMKLTGCLREGKHTDVPGGTTSGSTATSPSGATATAGSGGTSRYLLEVMGPEGGSSATGGTGARGTGSPSTSAPGAPTKSGSSGAMAAKTVYALIAPESVGLAKHVNHQIEVTGKRSAQANTASGTGGSTPGGTGSIPGSDPTASGSPKIAGTIEVSAVRMISASCQSTQ